MWVRLPRGAWIVYTGYQNGSFSLVNKGFSQLVVSLIVSHFQ
ncbi:MAG: hypothetical protein ABF790_07510 [Liquorilactobacillus nagelii]